MARQANRDDDVEPGDDADGTDPDEQFRQAKSVCLRLLAVRPRSRANLAKALARKGFDDEVAGEVLDRLEHAKLIDDAEFADMVVRSRHTHQGLGRQALRSQLVRQGVAAEIVEDAVSAIDPAEEEERARELVRKRMRGLASADDRTTVRRLVGVLARKGYPQGTAYRVVRQELTAAGRDLGALEGAVEEP